MNRLFVLRLAALLICAPAVAHAQTQIYPENNAPGGPIVVAVVADHYGPQDQATLHGTPGTSWCAVCSPIPISRRSPAR